MATRSTRNKLRFQAKKAIADYDRMLGHLQVLDEINDHQSNVVNINLPPLIVLLDEIRKTIIAFEGML